MVPWIKYTIYDALCFLQESKHNLDCLWWATFMIFVNYLRYLFFCSYANNEWIFLVRESLSWFISYATEIDVWIFVVIFWHEFLFLFWLIFLTGVSKYRIKYLLHRILLFSEPAERPEGVGNVVWEEVKN